MSSNVTEEDTIQQAKNILESRKSMTWHAEDATFDPITILDSPPTDGSLPSPAHQENIDSVAKLYDLNFSHMEHAMAKLREETSPSEVDWKVGMYILLCAWVVNWGTDPRAGQVSERPHSPTAQDITLVRNGARALAMEFEPFVDLSLTPWDPTSKTPSAGPFAGVFKPKTGEPFLILAFKGTTYEWEVNTDAQFSAAVVSTEIIYGLKAHLGMSRNLLKPFGATGRTESAFDIILAKLEVAAAKLKDDGDRKIPVYVTGHSLGAGFAIIAYMELIRRLGDKPSNSFILQDLWNYGAPRVFLAAGAQKMAEIIKDTNRHIYRVANYGDLVPTLPPIFGIHVDTGYKVNPEAASPEEYITERPSELNGRKPDDPVPSPDIWQKHWPPVYYRGIRKYLNPNE